MSARYASRRIETRGANGLAVGIVLVRSELAFGILILTDPFDVSEINN
ncbi:MAG: hypothetical protein INR71_10595 [Terriglobus roseus]|nr:hypothetical protein [Terriglobus roseus]